MTTKTQPDTAQTEQNFTVTPETVSPDHGQEADWGEWEPISIPLDYQFPWATFISARRFACKVTIAQEDGGFVSYAARLPGVVSQGDTFEEALDGIREALSGALASYLELKVEIPWTSEDDEEIHGSDPVSKWIDVDV